MEPGAAANQPSPGVEAMNTGQPVGPFPGETDVVTAETEAAGQPVAGAAAPGPGAASIRKRQILRLGLLLMAIAISLALIFFRNEFARFASLGYLGLFILGLVGSATVILPMPGLALAFAAGSSLTPWLVGLAFGTGAALGEMTGYLAGYGGSAIISDELYTGRVANILRSKWGALMVFALSLIPNPAFDLVGIAAGAMRIRVVYFLAAAWAGNVLKATMVALVGSGAINVISPMILNLLLRE
jgi:uncharacterized membrane protein YdjX (TVP38/TMEM64 family)